MGIVKIYKPGVRLMIETTDCLTRIFVWSRSVRRKPNCPGSLRTRRSPRSNTLRWGWCLGWNSWNFRLLSSIWRSTVVIASRLFFPEVFFQIRRIVRLVSPRGTSLAREILVTSISIKMITILLFRIDSWFGPPKAGLSRKELNFQIRKCARNIPSERQLWISSRKK